MPSSIPPTTTTKPKSDRKADAQMYREQRIEQNRLRTQRKEALKALRRARRDFGLDKIEKYADVPPGMDEIEARRMSNGPYAPGNEKYRAADSTYKPERRAQLLNAAYTSAASELGISVKDLDALVGGSEAANIAIDEITNRRVSRKTQQRKNPNGTRGEAAMRARALDDLASGKIRTSDPNLPALPPKLAAETQKFYGDRPPPSEPRSASGRAASQGVSYSQTPSYNRTQHLLQNRAAEDARQRRLSEGPSAVLSRLDADMAARRSPELAPDSRRLQYIAENAIDNAIANASVQGLRDQSNDIYGPAQSAADSAVEPDSMFMRQMSWLRLRTETPLKTTLRAAWRRPLA